MTSMPPAASARAASILLLGIVYLSFVSLGLPDAVMGVAWPAMRLQMGQPLAAMGILTITLMASAVTSAWLTPRLVAVVGTGAVVAGSCTLTGLALCGFSVAPSFGWLVLLAVPLGAGGGAVDASMNQFVAAHYTSRHMNWLHGFWGMGAATGPVVMGLALASAGGWAVGARHIGLIQLGLGVVLWFALPLWRHSPGKSSASNDPDDKPIRGASKAFKPLAMQALWLSPLCFLLYVAAEMGTYLWAASLLVGNRGIGLPEAGIWVSVYFASITLGRFSAGLFANHLGNRRLIALGIALATVGALLFALPTLPHALNLAGLVLMGLGCAPVFPSLMHEPARRFAPEVARKVIAWQMMASYAGGSVIPAAFGLIATWLGLEAVMPMVVLMLIVLALAVRRLNQLS
ncbi:MFS transporter [Hydrogenophaga sp. PAMC20947]|uniref:MFS transporter n=1 Tax=Hydrogenophaga sp. PAMC20947 TaxID=2565558 RepID=UPI00109E010C|nr:MFS transporter [Hydrogenophaga sp. PAMC20947]QCB44917.1 MFS transporter [Hydrogenophaga sp. PAMC20947]